MFFWGAGRKHSPFAYFRVGIGTYLFLWKGEDNTEAFLGMYNIITTAHFGFLGRFF